MPATTELGAGEPVRRVPSAASAGRTRPGAPFSRPVAAPPAQGRPLGRVQTLQGRCHCRAPRRPWGGVLRCARRRGSHGPSSGTGTAPGAATISVNSPYSTARLARRRSRPQERSRPRASPGSTSHDCCEKSPIWQVALLPGLVLIVRDLLLADAQSIPDLGQLDPSRGGGEGTPHRRPSPPCSRRERRSAEAVAPSRHSLQGATRAASPACREACRHRTVGGWSDRDAGWSQRRQSSGDSRRSCPGAHAQWTHANAGGQRIIRGESRCSTAPRARRRSSPSAR